MLTGPIAGVKLPRMKSALFGLAMLIIARASAYADPPNNVLVGARLYLTTTTVPIDFTPFTVIEHGFVIQRGTNNKSTLRLPALTIEGYINRSSFDPPLAISTATKPSDLTVRSHAPVDHIIFSLDSDLVQLKSPHVLVSTGDVDSYSLPVSMISRVEKYAGRFDGHTAYGQPFYAPKWQATLMRSKAPLYSCTALYAEMGNLTWISYNEKVGASELLPICQSQENPPWSDIDRLIEKGNVFPFTVPAD